MSLERDLNFGIGEEETLKPQLEKWIGGSIKKLDEMNLFDFELEEQKILIELKSRRITHNKYTTALIGQNKVNLAVEKQKEGYEIFFVFNYVDGIYFVKFHNEMVKYPTRYLKRFDRQWGHYVVEINVNELQRI